MREEWQSYADFEEDEGGSALLRQTPGPGSPPRPLANRDDLVEALDMMTEKRSSTRLSGLKKLKEAMQSCSELELVHSQADTCVDLLVRMLKAKDSEAEAAAEALGTLCVCLGPDEDERFNLMYTPLCSIITRHKSPAVRVTALQALSIGCFICSTSDDRTEETLDLLMNVLARRSEGNPVSDDLCAAALQGWGLLATTISKRWLAGGGTDKMLPLLHACMGCDSMEVRMAAGENLALLQEAGAQCRAQADDEEEASVEIGEEEDEGEGDGDVKSECYSDHDVEAENMALWEDVRSMVHDMVTESSKRLSKESRKRQRKWFREIEGMLVDGEHPEEDIDLKNGIIEVRSWTDRKQLDALRTCLQGGFQIQMRSNEILRDILPVTNWEDGISMGHVSKKSREHKQRSTHLKRERASKQAMKDAVLA
ncbi:unnamed protein product [Chrysoparadoxa australica]